MRHPRRSILAAFLAVALSAFPATAGAKPVVAQFGDQTIRLFVPAHWEAVRGSDAGAALVFLSDGANNNTLQVNATPRERAETAVTFLNAYLADLRRAAPVLGQTAVTGGEIGGRPAAFARVTTSVTDRSERGIEVELMITVIEAPDSLVTVQTATRTPLSRSQATSLLKIARSVRVE